MTRLFVGLEIPSTLRAELTRLQQAIPPGCRLSLPVNWHLTLAFIGEADLALVKAVLAAGTYQAPQVVLTEPGWFGRGERRTYWLGAERTPSLCALHQALQADLQAAGFEPDDKPFVPHITLARGRGTQADEEHFQRQPVAPGLEFHSRELCLYSSNPQPDGSAYRVEARYRLD